MDADGRLLRPVVRNRAGAMGFAADWLAQGICAFGGTICRSADRRVATCAGLASSNGEYTEKLIRRGLSLHLASCVFLAARALGVCQLRRRSRHPNAVGGAVDDAGRGRYAVSGGDRAVLDQSNHARRFLAVGRG